MRVKGRAVLIIATLRRITSKIWWLKVIFEFLYKERVKTNIKVLSVILNFSYQYFVRKVSSKRVHHLFALSNTCRKLYIQLNIIEVAWHKSKNRRQHEGHITRKHSSTQLIMNEYSMSNKFVVEYTRLLLLFRDMVICAFT